MRWCWVLGVLGFKGCFEGGGCWCWYAKGGVAGCRSGLGFRDGSYAARRREAEMETGG